jgi:hypothetical protein
MPNDYIDPDNHLLEDKVSKTMIGGDHYTRLDVQPWDAMQSWFPESFPDYLLMNAVKYLARDKGNKRQDVEKAKHYLDKWLEITPVPKY